MTSLNEELGKALKRRQARHPDGGRTILDLLTELETAEAEIERLKDQADHDEVVRSRLVMPFVVCASNGGTYDDHGFVAGYEIGHIDGLLEAEPAELERYVRTETMPQFDLLAMHHGYSLKSEVWDEHPDEWTHVVFTKQGLK